MNGSHPSESVLRFSLVRCLRLWLAMLAAGLQAAGFEVLNEVRLNQVLAFFGDDDKTQRVIAGLQADGTAWCGGTHWHGRAAMRISFSSWATRDEDVRKTLDAIVRIARSNDAA